MKKYYFLLLALLFCPMLNAQNWHWLNPKIPPENLSSVCAAGPGNYFIAGGHGTILKSTDDGFTWSRLNCGWGYDLYSVCFINPDTGFAAGDRCLLVKTTDGGEHWSTILQPDYSSSDPMAIVSVCFQDADHGTILQNEYTWTIWVGYTTVSWTSSTTDGGLNWSNSRDVFLNAIASMSFATPDIVCAVGGVGICRSANAGETWEMISTPTTNDLKPICFPSADTGYASGNSGTVLRTTDQGLTWNLMPKPTWNNIAGISFSTSSCGYAASHLYNEIILKTTNGGTTWNTVSTWPGLQFNTLTSPSPASCVAVGDNGTIVSTADSGHSWVRPAGGTLITIRSISFPDTLHGIAAGDSGIILYTGDGGFTWDVGASGSSEPLYSVQYINPATAFAVGSNGTVLRTVNGGSNWTSSSPLTADTLYSVFFPDAQTGYAAGANGTMLKTSDAGLNWTLLQTGNSGRLCSVFFLNRDKGFVSGAGGLVLKTDDGGSTWLTLSVGHDEELPSIWFVNDSTGYATGSKGGLFKTTNAGADWSYQMLSSIWVPMNSIRFINETTGYAAGNSGTIFKTVDGGGSWVHEDPLSLNHLYSVSFPDPRKAFVAGAGDNILYTRNIVVTGISEPGIPAHLQVYPVPSDRMIRVEFPMSVSRGVMTVYSMAGQELLKQDISGSKTDMNINFLPQGIYFLRLVSGTKVMTGKFIRE